MDKDFVVAMHGKPCTVIANARYPCGTLATELVRM
jgi:hypothetical protein